MKGRFTGRLLLLCALTGLLTAGPVRAALIIDEDFEGETGLPAGWTLVDNTPGTPTFSIVSGHDGTGGTTGNAGHIGGNYGNGANDTPGGWFQAPAVGVGSQPFTFTYDVRVDQEGTSDDSTVLFGDIANNNYYVLYVTEVNANNDLYRVTGGSREGSPRVDGYAAGVADDTWYRATVGWTPTSGTAGTLSVNVVDPSTSTSVGSFAQALTMDSAVQFGFGSYNDQASFDNITVDGTGLLPPPPPAAASFYLDIGPNNQRVESGHIPIPLIGAPNSGANGSNLAPTLVDVEPGFSFLLSIDNLDASGTPIGGIDWRDRGDSTATGDLILLGEDFVKNNLGIIRVTLSGLPAGDYDITSFHKDPGFAQCEAIQVWLDIGDGAGFVDMGVTGNASVNTALNSLTDALIASTSANFSFTLSDPGTAIILFDGSTANDDEAPLSGLFVDYTGAVIPEPATLALLALGGLGLLRRRRKH